MSEQTLNPSAPLAPRRPIAWAILLGVLLLAVGVVIAFLGIFSGIVVFNGCFANNGPFRDAVGAFWLFILWPLSLLATALVPPVLLGLGRGVKAALLAFVIGSLISMCVIAAWLPVGYYAFC